MIKRLSVIIFISLIFKSSYSQNKVIIADFEVINGDTVFLKNFPDVEIKGFKNYKERRAYHILKKRVLKVYPYALLAKEKLNKMEGDLIKLKKRKRKRYIRKQVNSIKTQYKDELKNLTMSEGKILVKLIHRETASTSYDIVKLYRGRFNAFFWQAMAKVWDNNLKITYDPLNVKEDQLIEMIILNNHHITISK
tara:strand:+ start:17 stop:598 length:582 start_codon:yes stop_codon:yes gene_type:complete